MDDPNEFVHFVEAQASTYDQVRRELAAGSKCGHWMWFIFPQMRGLGRSSMSQRYALDSVAQARRYLAHQLLGPRLTECTRLVVNVRGKTAREILGDVDALKFHSSVTLFSLCFPPGTVFAEAIDKYFAGIPDRNTLRLSGLAPERPQKPQSHEGDAGGYH